MQHLTTIQKIAALILPLLFAIVVHEVAHGWVANKLGDKTAMVMGRLTLNPIKHIDPIGTLLVPGLLLLIGSPFLFGWAKPVPVNFNNLRNPKRDMALVAAAGPFSNLIMAIIWVLVMKLGIMLFHGGMTWSIALVYMGQFGVIINVVLMVLNLIPIPPLDGSRIVSSLLPDKLAWQYNRLERYGFIILMVLLVTRVLGLILGPLVMVVSKLILAIVGL